LKAAVAAVLEAPAYRGVTAPLIGMAAAITVSLLGRYDLT
jgi:hypothetical protein